MSSVDYHVPLTGLTQGFCLTSRRQYDYNAPQAAERVGRSRSAWRHSCVARYGPSNLLGNFMTILERILSDKVQEVAERQRQRPLAEVQRLAQELPPPRNFVDAVQGGPMAHDSLPRIIAEVKKASPSKGVIRPDFDAVALAQTYALHGASALSVLTDEKYFQGRLSFLKAISRTVALPLLRKDFTIDPYQVYEARAAGADAVLLIVVALQHTQLEELLALTHELGMAALLEVHTVEELERILPLRPQLIGINNRDLGTFHTDIETTLRLLPLMPPEVVVISESGIQTSDEIVRLWEKGVHAFLVGESLMRHPDPGVKLQELLYGACENLRHHQP
jgi:indole-3-glycerol phosphate synthase